MKKLNKIGQSFYNALNFAEEYKDTILNQDLFINFLKFNKQFYENDFNLDIDLNCDIDDVVLYIRNNLKFSIRIHSKYFNEYFYELEEYDEFVRNNTDISIVNLVRFEEINYCNGYDLNDDFIELFRENHYDYVKWDLEKLEAKIEADLDNLLEINDYFEEYNNCDDFEDLHGLDKKMYYVKSMLYFCYEDYDNETIEEFKKYQSIKILEEDLDRDLKKKEKTTKKTKI